MHLVIPLHHLLLRIIVMMSFLMISDAYGQIRISGIVIDQNSARPLPFVSIAFEGTSQGSITNADGEFQFSIDTNVIRSLRFSCIGYEMVTAPVSVRTPWQIELKPAMNNLPEVVVASSKGSWLYNLIGRSVKEMRKMKSIYEPRAFFSLESSLNDSEPLEVMEAFYQCKTSVSNGLTETELKNGRFGLSPANGFFFLNLNTPYIIGQLKLFYESDFNLPEIPFSLTGKKMKQHFSFRLDSILFTRQNNIAVITFTPKSASDKRFQGTVYIDTASCLMQKIILKCQDVRVHPFFPIDTTHSISGISMKMVVNFKNDHRGSLIYDFIEFDYQFDYKTELKQNTILSKSIMLFYDYSQPFTMPWYIGIPGLTDFAKIISMPFNPVFWERNYLLPASRKSVQYTTFFRKSGLVVNYEPSRDTFSLLPSPVLSWRPGIKLSWKTIPEKNPGWIAFEGQPPANLKPESDLSRKYFIDYQILLDFNKETDTCYWQSRSLLFLGNSFYELPRDQTAIKSLELEFDLTEVFRLKLESQLRKTITKDCNLKTIKKCYDQVNKELDNERFLYKREVKRGADSLAFKAWKGWINKRLQPGFFDR